MRRVIMLGLTMWVWCVALGQAQAGPWLFTADEKKSKFDIEVTLDLGLVKESDDDSTRLKGTIIAELEPDEDPETIRITHVDAQPTKSQLQLKYSFGPFGIFGKANFTMTDFRIMLEPEDAGEAAELDEDGNFNQIENVPSMTGLVKYDLDTVAVKRKGEMDLSDPEEMPEDAPEPEPFDVEGQLIWDGDVPVLTFDFDIQQELKSDEFKGITVEVSAEGTIVALGERLVIEQTVLTIAPIDGGGLRLSWEPGDYVLEAATEVTFAELEIIELDEGQAEYVDKPSGDRPQRFYRLRSR
ncbi:MAG: hypothetical protein ACPGR8_11750 [Limisphaerales bacterium]